MLGTPSRSSPAGPSSGAVNVLVRPENLTAAPAEGGNGIVFLRTFLGATSRITVLLSGDLQVLVDVPSTHAAAMTPGASVEVGIPSDPVLRRGGGGLTPIVAGRRRRSVSRRSGSGTTARVRTAGIRSPASGWWT